MDNQTIIVKKIKKGGHGHHGGGWKVAFADFAVAMMAFFLLLWLIASATKEEKKGISEYFSPPTTGLAEGSGTRADIIDMGGGQKISQGDDSKVNAATPAQELIEQAIEAEKEQLESLMEDLKKAIEESPALKPFKDQLLLDITSEGLRIQIVDKEGRPMFDSGSSELKAYTKEILHELAKTINKVPNRISLTGHTDATQFVSRKGYTNWELSADRANASRRELILGGLGQTKIAKVVGLSSIVPFDKENPRSPINRRIALIVMNKAAEAALMGRGEQVGSEQEAKNLLQDANDAGESTGSDSKSLPGSTASVRPKPVVSQTVVAPKPAPSQKKPAPAKKSAAVEMAPEDETQEGILPIINPIKLPDLPGS